MELSEAIKAAKVLTEGGCDPAYLFGICDILSELYPVQGVPSDERAEEIEKMIEEP